MVSASRISPANHTSLTMSLMPAKSNGLKSITFAALPAFVMDETHLVFVTFDTYCHCQLGVQNWQIYWIIGLTLMPDKGSAHNWFVTLIVFSTATLAIIAIPDLLHKRAESREQNEVPDQSGFHLHPGRDNSWERIESLLAA